MAWTLVGMLTMLFGPAFGCAIAAYGVTQVLCQARRRPRLLAAASILGGALLCGVSTWITDGALAAATEVIDTMVSGAVVYVACVAICGKRPATSALCLATATAAALWLGETAIEARMQGTTITASVDALVETLRGVQTSLSTRAAMGTMTSLVSLLWPMAYVVTSAVQVACSCLGARIALRGMRRHPEEANTFSHFEMPLWAVGVLLGGVVLLVAARILPSWSDQLTMAGANVVMVVRVGLAVQGLALMSWLMQRYRFSGLAQAILFLLASYLELQFFVMSVVGLVDVWANFRQLDHGGSSGPKQAKE